MDSDGRDAYSTSYSCFFWGHRSKGFLDNTFKRSCSKSSFPIVCFKNKITLQLRENFTAVVPAGRYKGKREEFLRKILHPMQSTSKVPSANLNKGRAKKVDLFPLRGDRRFKKKE